MIIALSGRIGSGKNTVAEYLVKKYDFIEESFAKPVKDCLSAIFQWDRNMLDGLTEHDRKIRESRDEWWEKKLDKKEFSPRKAMTFFGTEIMRDKFNENIWLYSLEKRLLNIKNRNVVITDCRFTNEMEFLKSRNAISILIEKNEPFWSNVALEAKKGNLNSIEKLTEMNIHLSEWDLIDYNFDYKIKNIGSKNDLLKKVDQIIEEIRTNVKQRTL